MQLFTAPPVKNFQPTVIPDDVPVYRIKDGKFFADDELYEPGSIVVWADTPNLEMEPLNALALENMLAYLKLLDQKGMEVARATNTSYVSYEDAFTNSYKLAQQDGKKAILLNGREKVPLMGGKPRRNRRSQKIELADTPQQIGTSGKISLDGRMAVNTTSDPGIVEGPVDGKELD